MGGLDELGRLRALVSSGGAGGPLASDALQLELRCPPLDGRDLDVPKPAWEGGAAGGKPSSRRGDCDSALSEYEAMALAVP